MSETSPSSVKSTLDRILADPTPQDLWLLQKQLLALAAGKTPQAEASARARDVARAREVARAFHDCLRNLASKTASRNASRWGAALGTAAVGSTGLKELVDSQDAPLQKLMASGVPALLEVGSAVKSAEAWEVEARLIYDEVAWFLYEELWDIAANVQPADRQTQIDLLLDPVLDPELPDTEKAALVVRLFQAVLAARLQPLIGAKAR